MELYVERLFNTGSSKFKMRFMWVFLQMFEDKRTEPDKVKLSIDSIFPP